MKIEKIHDLFTEKFSKEDIKLRGSISIPDQELIILKFNSELPHNISTVKIKVESDSYNVSLLNSFGLVDQTLFQKNNNKEYKNVVFDIIHYLLFSLKNSK